MCKIVTLSTGKMLCGSHNIVVAETKPEVKGRWMRTREGKHLFIMGPEAVSEFNKNHDKSGRFASGKGSGKKKNASLEKQLGKLNEVDHRNEIDSARKEWYNKHNDVKKFAFVHQSFNDYVHGDYTGDSLKKSMESEAKKLSQGKNSKWDLEYQFTQAWFASHNISSVRLYRGVYDDSIKGGLGTEVRKQKAKNGSVLVGKDYITSWSSDVATAKKFAGRVNNGVTLARDVPVKQIISHWKTNRDIYAGFEREYIVMDSSEYKIMAGDIYEA